MKRNVIMTIISVLILTCVIAFARTTTTDLVLVKPTWTENVDILDDINANSDILEAFANDVLEFDLSPVLRANLDIATFNIEGVDATEFGYVDGVTSDIQTQFGLRYLKTEMDSFSELQAIISDKTLVNEEDVFTIDANWVNTTNPWADNEVSDTLTVTGYMQDEDVNTFSELDTWVTDKTLVNTTNKLSAFVATTSAELAGVISDETGSGKVVYNVSPVLYQNVTTSSTTNTLTVAEAGLILVSDAHTETLPTASGNTGLTYHFIKTDWDYDLITLEGDGAETFNYENSTGSPNLTYPRLNTPCAEVTIVSDGSNWQVQNEVIGQIPQCWAYDNITSQDNTTDAFTVFPRLNSETYDIGSNFDNSTWVSGTADGTVADHLQDDGESQFTSAMVGSLVKNTTDTTYAWITAHNDAGDVTISADIFVSTNGYEIIHSKFVVPVSGIYEVTFGLYWTTIAADMRFDSIIYKNTTATFYEMRHSSIVSHLRYTSKYSIDLNKDEYIRGAARASGTATADIYMGNHNATTFLKVKLLSKD